MRLALFALGIALAGHALTRWLSAGDRDAAEPATRAATSALCALAVAVALNWLLSALHLLTAGGLLCAGIGAGIAGAIALRRLPATQPESPAAPVPPMARPLVVLALAPLLVWLAYILWRGWLLPVLTHDALGYHMPKAVFLARGHGYRYFDVPERRIATTPANYELLLADFLLLTGSDRITEWIGTLSYLLFVLLSAALIERWWGRGRHVLAAALLAAGIPVVLLHSGAHKNDLLSSVFVLGALLFGARFAARGGRAPAALAIAAAALAVGTKIHGLFLAPALGLLFLARLRRGPVQARTLVHLGLFGVGAFLLLGGVPYLENIIHVGHLVGEPAAPSTETGYGDFGNLWAFPLLLLGAPFSPRPFDIWVPWRHQFWFWPRYELYFSHYGAPLSLLLLLAPLGLWYSRRREPAPLRGHERVLGALALALTFFLLLPVRLRPLGFFCGFPRYLVFVTPLCFGFSLVPFVRALSMRGPAARAAASALVLATAAILGVHAYFFGKNDRFAPWDYVKQMRREPGSRRIYFWENRAASMADRMAGPDDAIAIDASFDTWIYPAFGRDLTRRVLFVPRGPGPVAIPSEAKWVVIDRSWNAIWGHPLFRDMSQFHRYIGKGSPSPDDLRVFRALEHDPRWRLSFRDAPHNQAVFERVDAEP